ncbi:hypothetical protein D1012_14080 [Pseudotabrizicola alkalilacus]|uniref:Uncharacterized protein n=1 Tax=Pseudotabrizicola alkalilacus TaxID=2305252 RepID=A0A411Z119_9RHOB|nr:hypothetical protein D1012_14080 [Pseudotabrizicola alkalilacus]
MCSGRGWRGRGLASSCAPDWAKGGADAFDGCCLCDAAGRLRPAAGGRSGRAADCRHGGSAGGAAGYADAAGAAGDRLHPAQCHGG